MTLVTFEPSSYDFSCLKLKVSVTNTEYSLNGSRTVRSDTHYGMNFESMPDPF